MRRAGAVAAALTVVLAAAGCGISANRDPVAVGDGLRQGQQSSYGTKDLPDPSQYRDPADFIKGFLSAAVGGGKPGQDQANAFLSGDALAWFAQNQPDQQTDDVWVIRLAGPPQARVQQGDRQPFDVNYRVVGTLTARGRLNKLMPSVLGHMQFYVSKQEKSTQLQIDKIDAPNAPKGLWLLDEALADYYQIQPVYYWDSSSPAVLVPDLRYLSGTTKSDAAADQLVTWLKEGQSFLGGVQLLPVGTDKTGTVTISDDVIQVRLNAQAIAGDNKAEAAKRLLYQLQWTLRTGSSLPSIDLIIGRNETYPVRPSDQNAKNFNLESLLPTSADVYEVADGKARAVGVANAALAKLLAGPENANVASAAFSRDGQAAALVVNQNNARSLTFLRTDGKAAPPNKSLGKDIGRPVWVPGTDEVLVVAGNELYAVSSTGDGGKTQITPKSVGKLRSVSVAPDGRRIAMVTTDGDVAVAQIVRTDSGISLESDAQVLPIDPDLKATGVAWTDRAWLCVVGKTNAGPMSYNVTADGAVALSYALTNGIDPSDVVAFPSGGRYPLNAYVLTTNGATYRVIQGSTAPFSYQSPFFVS